MMPSEFWSAEYAEDAIKILREKEKKLPPILLRSPQLSSRSTLVQWIFTVSERFGLHMSTVHLSVYLLDRFMDSHAIPTGRLNLIALTCIELAAKFEESEVLVPKIPDMTSMVNDLYDQSEFIHMEGLIIKFFDWSLNIPLPMKFAEYYSLPAFLPSERNISRFKTYEEFWCAAQNAMNRYLDLSLEEKFLLQCKPSVVACSCIILARRELTLKPVWTERLARLTHYTFKDLAPCAKLLLRSINPSLRKRKITTSPDQGYSTAGSNHSSPETPPHKRFKIYGRPS